MRSNSTLLLGLSALALTLGCHSTEKQHEPPTKEQVASAEEFLFVQNSSSGTFDGQHLTLHAVAPTIFFSDRPYRVFGHVEPDAFISAWTRGPNSFATDPPNAILSLLGEESNESYMVELMDPRFSGGNLTYRVKVESGTIPASFKESSLFIDNEAWAAVGGFAAGHFLARRGEERRAAAYSQGATDQALATQTPSYYYNAAPPSAPAPAAPPPPPAPPAQQAPAQAVPAALQQAIAGMQTYAQTASPADQTYVQKLIQTLQSVSTDFSSVAK